MVRIVKDGPYWSRNTKKMALFRTAPATVDPFWTVSLTKRGGKRVLLSRGRVSKRRRTERGRANVLLALLEYACSHTLLDLFQLPALWVASLIMYSTLGNWIYCRNKDWTRLTFWCPFFLAKSVTFGHIFVSDPKRGRINLLLFYDQDSSQKSFLFPTYEPCSNLFFLIKFIKQSLSKFVHHTSDSRKFQRDPFFLIPSCVTQTSWFCL